MPAENLRLPLEAMMQRLAGVPAATVTVVTPNRRLAQELRARFDRERAAAGATSWETADILPFDALMERWWEDAAYVAQAGVDLPLLVTPAQDQALWEEAIRALLPGDALLSISGTASQARDAWRLAHAWRLWNALDRVALADDHRAFVEWAGRYRRICTQRGLIDRARLPDALHELIAAGSVTLPATLVLYGFDIITPQSREALEALAAKGVEVVACERDGVDAIARRVALASPRDEHEAAARWARARLEANPAARIGVVVPDLTRSRDAVLRAFTRVLSPAASLVPARAAGVPVDVSLGTALSDIAIIADALALLELLEGEIEFETASRLVRSPFLAGSESEAAARVRLDTRLRDRAATRLDLEGLVSLVGVPESSIAPILAERLVRLAAWRRTHRFANQGASDWAARFDEALRLAGFPGERTLDSAEYQAQRKWHETLAAFGALERVAPRMRLADARARLAHIARETLFQPEGMPSPIAILGLLESAGLGFDHLWVMGVADDAWPLPARPHPLLPIRAQRDAGVPEADAATSLELDRRITRGWMRAAQEVVFSHALTRDDAALAPSALIASVPEATWQELQVPVYRTLFGEIHARREVERIGDGTAPAVSVAVHPGGTRLFQDQAACPFRAFARHRLGSQALATPQPGLAASERGTLLHLVLAHFWKALRTKQALDDVPEADLRGLLEAAADAAIANVRRRRPAVLEGRFARLERDRLVRLALDWLATERRRHDFEVVDTEREMQVAFGGVEVRAKLDRIDRLHDGRHAVIDYKTGVAMIGAWLGERPDEPQLPMYALSTAEKIDVVAFARVRPGEMEFCGLAKEEGLLPNVRTIQKNKSREAKKYATWEALREGWARELEALGRSFAMGEARVDPKNDEATCRQCDQQVLCRIAEKKPQIEAGVLGDEMEDD